MFLGFCVHNHTLNAARERFLDRETAILSLVGQETRLPDDRKKAALTFLGEFFAILKDRKRFDQAIAADCRN